MHIKCGLQHFAYIWLQNCCSKNKFRIWKRLVFQASGERIMREMSGYKTATESRKTRNIGQYFVEFVDDLRILYAVFHQKSRSSSRVGMISVSQGKVVYPEKDKLTQPDYNRIKVLQFSVKEILQDLFLFLLYQYLAEYE